MKIFRVTVALCLLTSSGICIAQTGAGAASNVAEDTSGRADDIIVTAQRRAERLQDIPLSVSASSAKQLEAAGANNTAALINVVPGLQLAQNGSVGNFFLRGVGSTAGNPNDEQSVALYVDGVYIAAPNANQMDLANIDHVEVLKGPQGTLFGRNATGGVIQIVTKAPSATLGFNATLGYGNYATWQGTLYATGGLAENLAMDLAVSGNRQGHGYGTFFQADGTLHDSQISKSANVRSSLFYDALNGTKIRLTGDYGRLGSTGFDARLLPGVRGLLSGYSPPAGKSSFYDTFGNLPNRNDVEQYGVALNIQQYFGFANLVSITSYRHVDGQLDLDQDTTPTQIVDALLTQRQHNVSQEIQLLSPHSSAINWILGGYYYNSTAGYAPAVLQGLGLAPLPPVAVYGNQRTKSYSAFGQVTVPIVGGLSASGGLRYTDERQRYAGHTIFVGGPTLFPEATGKAGFKRLTYRAALNYKINPDVLIFASYSRGVKSGGFNVLAVNPVGNTPYRPEVLDSTEIGFKSELFDHLMRVNISAFHYKYKNIQLQATGVGGIRIYNAAAARINGVEAELQIRPAPGLTISSAASVLDGKYTNLRPNAATGAPGGDVFSPNPAFPYGDIHLTGQDLTGNRTVRTPKFSANLGASYEIPVAGYKLVLNGNVAYNDGFYFSVDSRTRQPSYTLVNASIQFKSDQYEVTLWTKNLLNKSYYGAIIEQDLGDLYVPAPPLTFGVTFGVHI